MSSITKVLITGSSGFIGSAIIKNLKQQGIATVGVDLAVPRIDAEPDIFHQVDVLDSESLYKIVGTSGVQAVIHLAATHDLSDMKNEQIGLDAYRTNIEGTRHLLDALASAPGIKRVIFTSTQLISRIGHQVTSLVDAKPDTYYGESKLLGEKMVHAYPRKPYVWSIVRPTTVWGPGMMPHYRRFIGFIEKGWYFHVSSRPLEKSYGYIENVTYQYVKILGAADDEVAGKTFYLADYAPLSLRTYANEIAGCLGVASIRTLPLGVCRLLALFGDILARFGLSRFPFTSFRINNILTEYVYQLAETEKICGPLPVGFKQAVERMVVWYKSELR